MRRLLPIEGACQYDLDHTGWGFAQKSWRATRAGCLAESALFLAAMSRISYDDCARYD
jgi:hypothetical protein